LLFSAVFFGVLLRIFAGFLLYFLFGGRFLLFFCFLLRLLCFALGLFF